MTSSAALHRYPTSGAVHSRWGETGFSGEPVGEQLPVVDQGIDVIRHIAVKGHETASLIGRHPRHDALLLVLNGAGRLRGEVGDMRVDCNVERGSVGFTPAGQAATLDFPARLSGYSIGITQGRLAALTDGGVGGLDRPLVGHRDARLTSLVSLLVNEATRPGFASDLLIDGLLRAIAGTLAGIEATLENEPRIRLTAQRLALVTDFLEANLDQHIGLHDMAAAGGLSPFHFSRVFKHATGKTPYQYLLSRRIERACRLLGENTMSLAELALACGFGNQSHFTAAFSRETGVSPGRYRQQVHS